MAENSRFRGRIIHANLESGAYDGRTPDPAECTVDSETYGGDKAKPVEFRARLKEYRGDDYNDDYNSVFFYWEYCRLYNGISPNFYPNDKAPNKAIIELCDDVKFNEFVTLCAEKIKAFLDFSPENYK